MEQTKIYQALMTLFENEETWFSENAYVDEETLQENLEECRYSNDQITFADKHWSLIEDSIAGSQWAQAYEALIELRVLWRKPENPIKKKRIIKRKRTETTCE